ncbi:MAG TPA: hypothetical protein DEO56_08865 [Nitrosomonas nitrosa]|nr:hypothetical protein [Nitrosomonas nitrosa]
MKYGQVSRSQAWRDQRYPQKNPQVSQDERFRPAGPGVDVRCQPADSGDGEVWQTIDIWLDRSHAIVRPGGQQGRETEPGEHTISFTILLYIRLLATNPTLNPVSRYQHFYNQTACRMPMSLVFRGISSSRL